MSKEKSVLKYLKYVIALYILVTVGSACAQIGLNGGFDHLGMYALACLGGFAVLGAVVYFSGVLKSKHKAN